MANLLTVLCLIVVKEGTRAEFLSFFIRFPVNKEDKIDDNWGKRDRDGEGETKIKGER